MKYFTNKLIFCYKWFCHYIIIGCLNLSPNYYIECVNTLHLKFAHIIVPMFLYHLLSVCNHQAPALDPSHSPLSASTESNSFNLSILVAL